jgi:hypothetical protein
MAGSGCILLIFVLCPGSRESDEIALTRAGLMPGLKEKYFVELTKSEFLSHFNPILERASKTAHITDEDVEEINNLKINNEIYKIHRRFRGSINLRVC